MPNESQLPRVDLNLRLKVGGDELLVKVSLPAEPIRPIDLLPILQRLDDTLVDAAIAAVQREGKTVSCRAGCGACCRQLVPISRTEAHCLTELIVNLPEDRRNRVVDRFREAAAALRLRVARSGPGRARAHRRRRTGPACASTSGPKSPARCSRTSRAASIPIGLFPAGSTWSHRPQPGAGNPTRTSSRRSLWRPRERKSSFVLTTARARAA